MDLLQNRTVKVRKPQRCHGCLRLLPTGIRMRYAVQVDADDLLDDPTYTTCRECGTVLGRLHQNADERCPTCGRPACDDHVNNECQHEKHGVGL